LVLLAEDGSRTQQEKVLPLARARGVRWVILGDRARLGAALGSGPLATVAVTRPSFAKQIEALLGQD
jgi:ribosomal protein L7Ae-like RNA K-turn-binding protein